jgi:hypothetical protein
MALESRLSRSIPINHMQLEPACQLAPLQASPSDRASLGICAGTRHPEERLHVHRTALAHQHRSPSLGLPYRREQSRRELRAQYRQGVSLWMAQDLHVVATAMW